VYLTQPLHRAVQQEPETAYTVYEGRAVSARETYDRVARLAAGLKSLGVTSGARVGVLTLNTDAFLQAVLAIAWADAVIVPLNTRWAVAEHVYALSDSEVAILVVDDQFLPMVDELRSAVPGLRTLIHHGAAQPPSDVIPIASLLTNAPAEDAHRRGDSLLGIFYTGGTTGRPKGVMLSHRAVFVAALGTVAATTALSEGGASILVAPAFHMGGFSFWVQGMLSRMTTVPQPVFDPRQVMRAIQEHRAKRIMLVPTMIQMILDHPEYPDYDLTSLEMLGYGAAPISEALLVRARAAFPAARLVQGYGMTELSAVTTLLTHDDHADPRLRRSAGRAAPHSQVKIVDQLGVEAPRGEVGEIVTTGEHVMLGYWNKPDETAEALRDSWLHTGDTGYMDEHGYVYVVDRMKDMIVSGGENVYSIEVENAIALHQAVAQVAVIGIPDEVWGEGVHAVVMLRPGHSLTLEELRLHCQPLIASYKTPRSFEIVTEFPLSGAGKILKRQLRDLHQQPA
jgi:acyl-CoA synthetase (AMP-forming)/AMP-acid ligase II